MSINVLPVFPVREQPLNAVPRDMITRGRPPKIDFADRPAWANRLLAARRRSGLTQAQLAAAAGLSQSTIADYEVGRSEPSLNSMARLAKALQVDVEFLITTNPAKERGETDAEHNTKQDTVPAVEYSDSSKNDGLFIYAYKNIEKMLREEQPHARYKAPDAFLGLTRSAWSMALTMSTEKSLQERIDYAVTALRMAQRAFAKFPGGIYVDDTEEDQEASEAAPGNR
jgi:transcriptional regulator with XRE-family HTH domain